MIKTTLAVIALAATLYVGAQPVGPAPALGPFLDPIHGVWSIAGSGELPDTASVSLVGLGGTVRVLYDDRDVPHIFASSVDDATRALGYVVARDRLFQLELQTRATAGTLTEIVGPAVLEVDRAQRELGLAWAAERNFAVMEASSEVGRRLQAYTDGVNAWIEGLRDGDVPLEFYLVGARPQEWKPQYGLYLLKRMGWTLSYNADEWRKRTAAGLVGWDAAMALFPRNNPIQEPIQPNGSQETRFDDAPLPPPGEPAADAVQLAQLNDRLLTPTAAPAALFGLGQRRLAVTADCMTRSTPDCVENDDVVIGSNNWAAGPIKTANGHALLAGDPHLGLTLPSIWYEAHMVVPGELDVYGVTIPGTPGIVIGFNRDVAWSFTNTESDALDHYLEEVDDAGQPRHYMLDGVWMPLELRIEEYRNRVGRVIATDTVYHTHRGPVIRNDSAYYSIRWTVLEDQGELLAFDRAHRARSVDEWLKALEPYEAPTQNGLVADRNGSIAVRATGRYPIRPGNGRGDIIRDGTTRASDWIGDLGVSRYPFSIDPAQGYLVSANQQPIDPRASDIYYGADWPSPWRAIRINELIREHDDIDGDDFARFQTDPGSARADFFVPAFLAAAARREESGQADELLVAAGRLLSEWDLRYTKENTRAVLFEMAMTELSRRTWDELDDHSAGGARRRVSPGSSVLARLMVDATSPWWDDRSTPDIVEQRDDILSESLSAGLERARAEHGSEDSESWRWDRIRHANIFHLAGIPALSALDIPVQGGPSTIAPSSGGGTHGASWRMVVEMGDEVTASAIYPGGQSGNPLSTRYKNRITAWAEGDLEPVLFPRSPDELNGRVVSVLTLEPR